MSARHIILYTIDRAVRFLFWTKGELVLILGPLFTGIIFNAFIIGSLWTGINVWAIRLFKRRMGEGLLKALLYWYFPATKPYKSWPPSYVGHFIG